MTPPIVALSACLARGCWAGVWVLGSAWVVTRFVPSISPGVRCWLWRLAYLKLLASLLVVPPIALRLLPTAPAGPAAVALGAVPHSVTGPTAGLPLSRPAPLARSLEPIVAVMPWVLALWIAGVAWAGVGLLRQWRDSEALRRRCTPVRGETWLRIADELCGRLAIRRCPPLLIAPGGGSPLLLGGAAPAIIIPADLARDCSDAEMRLMLAHELAHLKRRDLAWGWLPALAHSLFFFHPMVRVANRHWRLAQEMACDELCMTATRSPAHEYGATLLKIAAQSRSTVRLGLAVVGPDEFPQTLKRRLMAMKSMKPASRTRAILTGVALAAAATVVLVPWRVVAQTDPKADGQNQKQAGPTAPPTEAGLDAKIEAIAQQALALGLSDDQRSRIQSAVAAAESGIHGLFANGPLTDEQMAQLKQVLGAGVDGIMAALTADQQKQLGAGKGAPGKPADMIAELSDRIVVEGVDGEIDVIRAAGLTNVQTARLQALIASARAQVAAVLNAGAMTPDLKMRVFSVVQGFETSLAALLTPDQTKRLMASRPIESGQFEFKPLLMIDLSDAQKTRLNVIVARWRATVQAAVADRGAPVADRIARADEASRSAKIQIGAMLTPEQQSKMTALTQQKSPLRKNAVGKLRSPDDAKRER